MMRRFLIVLFTVIALVVVSRTAFAQTARRTWVSAVGDDVNACTRTAPCRTFAGAIAKTAAGGEIDVLDSGGFGAVTITKSITIDGTGAVAGISSAGANGVVINDLASATPNNIVVTLRGLTINGAGVTLGVTGIKVTAAKAVNIEDCVIANHSTAGIDASVGAQLSLVVRNSVIRNNAADGIIVATSSSSSRARATITGSTITNNGTGVHAMSNSLVAITRSELSNNTSNGVNAAGSSGPAVVSVVSSLVSLNFATGLLSSTGGNLLLTDCDIFANATGVSAAGGTTATYGDNRIHGNGTDGCGGCPAAAGKQ